MRVLFQKSRARLILGCACVLILALMVWRPETDVVPSRRPPDGPSDAVIQRGIAAAILAQRHLNTHGAATAPPTCDLACAAQFAIEVKGVSERRSANRPSFWGDAGSLPYHDVTVSLTPASGGSERLTVRFWDTGAGWEIGEPLLGSSIHLTVTDLGGQSFGIE